MKYLLNSFFIIQFYNFGYKAYYGSITATILGYLFAFIICIISLKVKYKVSFKDTLFKLLNIIVACIFMTGVLFAINLFIPNFSSLRILNLPIVIFFTLVGAIIYFLYLWYFGVIEDIFGKNILKKVRKMI